MAAHRVSRRTFLKTGAALTGAAVPLILAAGVRAATKPNERITVGMIGVGRQGVLINLKQFLASEQARVVAVADVDAWRAANAKSIIDKHYGDTGAGCAAFHDFREMLARPDIDAIMVSTPDHWHCAAGIAAAKAGKHVSVEKPLSTCVAHGRQLCEAVRKQGVVSRTDSEFRSLPAMWQAVQAVRNGRIGTLQHINVGAPADSRPIGNPPETPVPEGLDYDFWLGPAAPAPYTEKRVHPRETVSARPGWLRISDYTNGMVSNWGSHLNDIAQWANDSDRSGPVSVEGTGSFSEGLWDTIVDFQLHYAYANGVTLDYSMGKEPGVEFQGSDGWVKAFYPAKIEASDPAILDEARGASETVDLSATLTDKEDFLTAIREGRETLEPVEVGHRTVSLCQIGLIAIQTGRKLQWDPEKERFAGDEAANALLDRPVRGDWFKV